MQQASDRRREDFLPHSLRCLKNILRGSHGHGLGHFVEIRNLSGAQPPPKGPDILDNLPPTKQGVVF
jgi:hypothetical protein